MRKTLVSILAAAAVFIATTSWAAVEITVGSGSGRVGDTVEIPITVSDTTGQGIIGCDIILKYSPTMLTLTNVLPGDLTSGWEAEVTPSDAEKAALTAPWHYPVYNTNHTTGIVKVALYGRTALAGQGSLAKLSFRVNDGASGSSALTLVQELTEAEQPLSDKSNRKTQLNEGQVASTLANGSFTISAGRIDGDVDGDSRVTLLDVQLVVDYIADNESGDPVYDVNNDSKWGAADYRRCAIIYVNQR